ncbi:MAG: MBL fold metallo-hydrolase [Casimicrobiaceae bacterium]
MRLGPTVATTLLTALISSGQIQAQRPVANTAISAIQVVLLGTAGGPTINPQRQGVGTLVTAGPETLLFDAGRGVTTSMARLSINASAVTKVFLTHLHSDHVISLPEIWLFPWASQGRQLPLQVWGPQGTRSMLNHLQAAFAFDVHIRRDVDEKFSPDGVKIVAGDVREGVVYESHGVKVTAFGVDHGPVKPAFGYRVDYGGHSVVMSGDTRPSDNLIKYSHGADVLIHEVGRSKQDPALVGPPDEPLSGREGVTRGQAKTIAEHHTDAIEAARVFQRVNPRLAVFSHANLAPAATLATVRESYAGRLEFGADLMRIDIGDEITIRPFDAANK